MKFGKFTPWNEWKDHLDGTEEEREADQKRREQERLKYPWRYRGKKSIQEYMCCAHEKKTQYEIHKKKRGRK